MQICGDSSNAVKFLEETIDIIDPASAASRKRTFSEITQDQQHSKFMKPIGPSEGPISRAGDIINELYVNDEIDERPLTMVVLVPNDMSLCSHIIGKQGCNVTDIKRRTGIRIQLEQSNAIPLTAPDRNVFLTGKLKDLCYAYQLMHTRMEEKQEFNAILESSKMVIPNEIVAHIIGKQGVIIKKLQSDTSARTQFQTEEEMFQSGYYYGRTIIISGQFSQRLHAMYSLLRQVAIDRFLPSTWKGGLPLQITPGGTSTVRPTNMPIMQPPLQMSNPVSSLPQAPSAPQVSQHQPQHTPNPQFQMPMLPSNMTALLQSHAHSTGMPNIFTQLPTQNQQGWLMPGLSGQTNIGMGIMPPQQSQMMAPQSAQTFKK